jgi:uncharacterized membrane protein
MAVWALADKTIMKLAIVLAFAIVGLAALAAPAKADFTVCNHTTQGQLDVAVAYEYNSGNSSYSRSEGYWNIPQGECRNTLKLSGNERVYVWAWLASDNTKTWSGGNGSGFESHAKQFCMDPVGNAFTYKGDAAVSPCDSPSQARTFRFAGTADTYGDFTYTLGD